MRKTRRDNPSPSIRPSRAGRSASPKARAKRCARLTAAETLEANRPRRDAWRAWEVGAATERAESVAIQVLDSTALPAKTRLRRFRKRPRHPPPFLPPPHLNPAPKYPPAAEGMKKAR